jgi:hypothetical protein
VADERHPLTARDRLARLGELPEGGAWQEIAVADRGEQGDHALLTPHPSGLRGGEPRGRMVRPVSGGRSVGSGVEGVLGFPGHVGVGGSVLVAGEGADEAEGGGVEVVAGVGVVGGEGEGEAHDVDAVDANPVEERELVDEESCL